MIFPFAAQVNIEAPVTSIATLALHKWLQDLHQKVQVDGPACLQKQIILSVGLWTRTTSQTPASTPARTDTAPQISPEEEESASPQAAAQSSAQAGSQEAATAAAQTESQGTLRSATDSGAGPSSPALRAARSRSPQTEQKRMASALPAVAARIFGPEHDVAANQAAVFDMVRGFGLPFTLRSDSDRFVLAADGEAVTEWLQAGRFEAIMTGFAQPVTSPSPLAGEPLPGLLLAYCYIALNTTVCTRTALQMKVIKLPFNSYV